MDIYEQAAQACVRIDCDLAWIEVKGPDAKKFLNGVLTNDINKLQGTAGCYTLMLTPKGKIVADCFCYPCGDHFGIVCENRLKEAIFTNLKKYIIFQKIEVDDQSEKWGAFALLGPKGHEMGEKIKEREVWVILTNRWGLPYAEIWARKEELSRVKEKIPVPRLDPETEEVLRIESGTPAFGKDFDENTIPQEANLYHALSFDKGCYVGQEIVARLEHRGHVGKQLVQISLEATTPPQPGEKIFSNDGKEIGIITSGCLSHQTKKAIALGYLRYQFLNTTEARVGEDPAKIARLVKKNLVPG